MPLKAHKSSLDQLVTSILFTCLCFLSGASAQEYPSRPIRIVSTTPTAGAGDIVVRLIGDYAARKFGQGVLIDVQSAATGQIGTQMISRAEPDGYSLLWGNSNLINTQAVKKKLPFDVLRDLTPINLTVSSPLLLVINSSLPVSTLSEFVDYARKNGGKLAYGSVGIGSGIHLTGESLSRSLGVALTHVPYASSGMSTQISDLLENRIQIMFISLTTIQSVLPSGKARIIAVMSKDRYPYLPEAPPIAEVLPDFVEIPVWFGMLGPASTPAPIVKSWNDAIVEAVHDPAINSRLLQFGLVLNQAGPQEMAKSMSSDLERISTLARAMKIELD